MQGGAVYLYWVFSQGDDGETAKARWLLDGHRRSNQGTGVTVDGNEDGSCDIRARNPCP
jgi:hypothetical protein